MTKEILKKANDLDKDICAIGRILEEHSAHNWIQVVSSRVDNVQTRRFQNELAEWLKGKKSQYEKELEEL